MSKKKNANEQMKLWMDGISKMELKDVTQKPKLRTQIKSFDDYMHDCMDEVNEFMSDKDVIDVKMNTVVDGRHMITSYLVIYREVSQ
ncbi:hypothetical protein HXA31_20290 [Salipaludibacillus agaradhaerens]|uniref:Uncharacterized protein n=1 Tax=Salipaludibacillus agaradhaerens TaxID=76935 RepID=A0A9Q4FZ15_SALAG|nr:hypothetical protein [Salipaludibacillus agaradhaerens]MCR6096901.1 hypothetical protein [Salipaludibacillus agaradhaerens]MCR6116671.1 hypothetical protein [Salipaludibacillus agaradhaerens]